MSTEIHAGEEGQVSTLEAGTQKGVRLLVVDDDEGMRETLADIFEMEGYRVDAVADAQAALDFAGLRFYHLALLDLKLPGVNGLDLLTQIKGMSPDTVVMLITGHASVESSVDAINLGAEGYILKPIDIPEVKASILRALEKQRLVFQNRELMEELREMNKQLEAKNQELEEEIAERRSLQSQLVESEKMLAIYQLAAGVTHEIANPLTTVMGRVQLLLRDARKLELPGSVVHSLEIVQYEAGRTVQILDNLALYSRCSTSSRRLCNLNVAVERTLSLFGHELDENNILLTLDLSPEVPELLLGESQLMRAFAAVIRNAAQAMPEGGELTIRSRRGTERVEVTFQDTGVGVPAEIQNRIFEPFFTTKEPGSGIGVGLSAAYKIIKDHGGRIELDSTEGEGTTLRILLPLEASDDRS